MLFKVDLPDNECWVLDQKYRGASPFITPAHELFAVFAVTLLMLPDSRCRYHVQGNCNLMLLCFLDVGHSTRNLHRAYSEYHQQPAPVLQHNRDHHGLGVRAGECCLLLSNPAKASHSTTDKAGGPAALLGLILCRKATQV